MIDNFPVPAVKVFASDTEPVLKILFYLDDVAEFNKHGYAPNCVARALSNSGAQVDLRDRTTVKEITADLLRTYDEVWFFLISRNMDERLTDKECVALREWMDRGGGVLLTGDHADVDKDSLGFEGLGRPIGGEVPRARHMRVWDGPPGAERKYGKIDSTEISGGRKKDPSLLEEDTTPQRLLLPLDPDNTPHALFLDAHDVLLDRLPDHIHEGKVLVPRSLADAPGPNLAQRHEWWGATNLPEIVARGVDWRNGVSFDLMAAWDGHVVHTLKDPNEGWQVCGRILADSSWHHYADYNLKKILRKGLPLDQWKIRDLYLNIAAWLAPPKIQSIYRGRVYKRVSERIGSPDGISDEDLGVRALQLFAELLPGAWYHQLIDDRLAEHAAATMQSLPRESVAPLIGASMRRYIAG